MMPRSASASSVTLNFNLVGDQFPHAWFFNRFRVERIDESFLVTIGLVSPAGMLATNAFVLGATDHEHNRERCLSYIENFPDVSADLSDFALGFSTPPERVYPVNHIALSRVGSQAEIGLYRFSINTLADAMREGSKHSNAKPPSINCYPVVMFRCDLPVQLALLKEFYSLEGN